MTALALPWFVLVETGSPARTSFVVAAEVLAAIVCAIPVGALTARLGPRGTMLVADVVSALLVALIPLLHFVGALSFPLLLLLAFLIGAVTAPYVTAPLILVADLVSDDQDLLARANALLQMAMRTTYLVGPALAGALIAALGAPAVLLLDGATYLVSFVLIALFVPQGRRAAETPDLRGIFAGVKFLRRDRLVRSWAIAQTFGQGSFQALVLALPILAFLRYEQDAVIAGTLLAAWGGGAVVGSALAYPAVKRWDPLRLGRTAWLAQALPLWLLTLRLPAAAAAVVLVLSGVGNGLRNPPLGSFITLRIPPFVRMQTGILFTSTANAGGLAALGCTGIAAEAFGLDIVFAAIAAVATGSAILFGVASRNIPSSRRSADVPTQPARKRQAT